MVWAPPIGNFCKQMHDYFCKLSDFPLDESSLDLIPLDESSLNLIPLDGSSLFYI